MNKTTVSLYSSGNSNCILLVFSLLIIFLLSSGNFGVAVHLEVSLSCHGLEYLLKRLFLFFVGLGRGIWNDLLFFLFIFSLSKGFTLGEKIVSRSLWRVVNETTVGLDSSSDSNSVLLVFGLLIIFSLSCSNFRVTSIFKISLFLDSFKNNLKGVRFLFIRF